MNKKLIIRQHLIKKFKRNTKFDIYYINAPAGYGKTTFINQLAQLSPEIFHYVQIPLKAKFTSISFIYFLTKKLFPQNSSLIEEIKESNQNVDFENSEENFIGMFVNSLTQDKSMKYLVIDDLQNMVLELWFIDFVQKILDFSDSNLKLVLLSRDEPIDEFSLFLAKRRMLLFDRTDLILSDKELIELAKSIYGIDLSLLEAEKLNKKFDGWITGYHFFFEELQTKGKSYLRSNKYPILSYNYLAYEIFSNKSAYEKKFILYSALLDKFTKSDLKEIFGFNDSSQRINSLSRKNVFLEEVEVKQDTGEIVYKYIDLYRSFLNEMIKKEFVVSQRNKLNSKIASYFLKMGNYRLAADYYCRANNKHKVKAIVKKHYQEFLDTYNYELINYWLKFIGSKNVNDDAVLLFINGLINYKFYHDLDKSEQFYQKALMKVKKQNEKFVILFGYLNLLLSKIKMQDVIQITDNELKNTSSKKNKIKLLRYKGIAYHQLLDFKNAIQTFKKAVMLAESIYEEKELNLIKLNLARSYFMTMDHQNCLSVLDAVKIEKLTLHNQFVKWKCENELFMICGYNIERFDNSYREMKKIYIDKKVHSLRRKYLDATSEYFTLGDFEKSSESFEELCSITKNKTEYFSYYTHKMMYSYFLKDADEMRKAMTMAKKYFVSEFIYVVMMFKWAESLFNILTRKYHKAEKPLIDLIENYKNADLPYGEIIITHDLIKCYLLLGKKDEALNAWKKVESASIKIKPHAFELIRILYDREIIDFLILNNLETINYNYLYRQISKLHNYSFVSDGYKERLKDLRSRAIDIKLETFDNIELSIRGIKIDDTEFSYKKWKLILSYILINYHSSVSKDEIITRFFEDMSLTSANNKFHQMISNFRKILTPNFITDGYFKENTFSFLEYSDNKITLRKNFNYNIDVVQILEVSDKIKNKKTFDNWDLEEIKEALKMLNGTFLKGIYDDWVEDLRDKLSLICDDLYNVLIEQLKLRNNHKEIIEYSEVKIKIDPQDINAHINSIESELSLQNISKARKKKERLTKASRNFVELPVQIKEKLSEIVV